MFVGMESHFVATTGFIHTLIVNRKGEMYITSGRDYLCIAYSALN